MTKLYIDIETRSCCDLRKCGQYVYAEHPTTEIIVVCWCVEGGPMRTWKLGDDQTEMRAMLNVAADNPDVVFIAHNASFERILLTGEPGLKLGLHVSAELSRWNCTAARAAAVGLPRALGGAASALGLSVEKDKEGQRLMLQMCKPKPRTGINGVAPVWFEDDARLERLAAYCRVDVEVERQIDGVLPELPREERRAWETTERMNDRGVPIDTALVTRLVFLVQDAELRLNAKLDKATGGAVKRVTDHMALTRWLDSKGVPVDNGVNKAAIRAMIEGLDREDQLVGAVADPDRDLIREVLIMRQEGGKSSAAKYRALLQRMSADGRIRGALTYCGAAATGRWSSRGVQLQNLPRSTGIDSNGAIEAIMGDMPLDLIDFFFGPPLVVAAELLRPVFTAGE